MDSHNILTAINTAFGNLPRPVTMVRNPDHCDECAEHEATMQAVTPETISPEQVGSPAWDPVCFITDETFCYFMPGFARLVLSDDMDENDYIYQLLFHLDTGFRTEAFDDAQRQAVADLIDYVAETRLDEIINNFHGPELGRVMDALAQPPGDDKAG